MHTTITGHMAHGCHIATEKPSNFSSVLKAFEPDLKRLAKRFPFQWQDDFIQEGSIALYNVFEKFILNPSGIDFRNYALTAAHRRMIDFYRKIVERAPITEAFQNTVSEMAFDDDYVSDCTEIPEFSISTTTFELDYNVVFSLDSLRQHSFTEREIALLSLHLKEDLTVSESAERLSLSVGQASKILSSAKKKSSQLWLSFTK